MTTPHEAVTEVISNNVYEYYVHGEITAETTATAAIEALRAGARERVTQGLYDACSGGLLSDSETSVVIDAVLGPPNEVPE